MSEAPDPFAGVPEPLRLAMQERGFEALTAVQTAVLGATPGANLRISSQTGSGKTAAIGLLLTDELLGEPDGAPSGPRVLIVTPTRELASQVREELGWVYGRVRNVAIDVVTGGTDIIRERRRLAKHPVILVGTPGRLLDHCRSKALDLGGVRHVVLDEADQMLDMGFRDELDAIVEALPPERRSHLVSATFPPAVKRLADAFQPDAEHLQGTALGKANENIQHVAHVVAARDRYDALVNTLLWSRGERTLVFVQRRIDASDIAEQLARDGFSAMPLSGDLAQAQRTRTLNSFKHGRLDVLVATDVAARGIDVSNVATVVHFDMPFDAEAYTHRSGRTGRAGLSGISVLLVTPAGRRRIAGLARRANVDLQWSPLPTAAKIRKAATKHFRRELHKLFETEAADHSVEYAKKLLTDHAPEMVVAHLLQLAEPPLPAEPRTIREQDSRAPERGDDRRERRPRRERDDRGAGERRPGPGPGAGPRSGAGRREDRGDSDEYRRFMISWGEQRGASPARILAHVCRRGDVDRTQVGAVRIGPRSSVFEIREAEADAFAQRVRAPDDRDPFVKIKPYEDRPPGDAGRPHGPARKRPPGRGKPGPKRPASFRKRQSDRRDG